MGSTCQSAFEWNSQGLTGIAHNSAGGRISLSGLCDGYGTPMGPTCVRFGPFFIPKVFLLDRPCSPPARAAGSGK